MQIHANCSKSRSKLTTFTAKISGFGHSLSLSKNEQLMVVGCIDHSHTTHSDTDKKINYYNKTIDFYKYTQLRVNIKELLGIWKLGLNSSVLSSNKSRYTEIYDENKDYRIKNIFSKCMGRYKNASRTSFFLGDSYTHAFWRAAEHLSIETNSAIFTLSAPETHFPINKYQDQKQKIFSKK